MSVGAVDAAAAAAALVTRSALLLKAKRLMPAVGAVVPVSPAVRPGSSDAVPMVTVAFEPRPVIHTHTHTHTQIHTHTHA